MPALSFSHLSRGARCCQITIASHTRTSALYPRILHIHIRADEDSVSVSEGTGAEASGKEGEVQAAAQEICGYSSFILHIQLGSQPN